MKIQPTAADLRTLAPPGAGSVRQPQAPAPSDPSDRVELLGVDRQAEAPEVRIHHLKGWARAGLFVAAALAGVAGLAGCAATPSTPPSSTTCTAVPAAEGNQAAAAMQSQSQTGSMEFQVVPEGLGRIDLIRQTESKSTTDSDGNTSTTEEDVAYSPFGVYLGNGLFHDTNGNLSLVPGLAFQEGFAPAPSSTICFDGPWGADYQVAPDGQGVTLDGPWGSDFTVTRDGQVTKVDGPWGNDHEVTAQGDTVKVDGPWSKDYKITRSGDTIKSDGPWGDDYTVQKDGDRTQVDGPWGRDYTIQREGNTINVSGPWGSKVSIVREGDTLTVKVPWSADYKIIREGDSVRVDGPWGVDSTTTWGR